MNVAFSSSFSPDTNEFSSKLVKLTSLAPKTKLYVLPFIIPPPLMGSTYFDLGSVAGHSGVGAIRQIVAERSSLCDFGTVELLIIFQLLH